MAEEACVIKGTVKLDKNTHKLCNGCNTIKPKSEFYPSGRFKSGVNCKCKACIKVKNQQVYQNRKQRAQLENKIL